MSIMLSTSSQGCGLVKSGIKFNAGSLRPRAEIKELELETLLPCLSVRNTKQVPKLSSDGYYDCVVSLALCTGLDMTLNRRNGETVSYSALANMGIGVHSAWNIAAYNVINVAHSSMGISFFHRPWRGGFEIKGDGSPTSSWLAHPVLFAILNDLATELFGSNAFSYLLPGRGRVIVAQGSPQHLKKLLATAQREPGGLPSPGFDKPLVWSNGFPKPL